MVAAEPIAPPLRPSRLERGVALAAILVALVHVALFFGAMGTTSLSTDEFGTIFSYSADGPRKVMTEYNGPKNHVFFNLLNSLLPARDSVHPTRARLLNVLAALGVVGVMIALAVATGRWLETAAWLALWAGSAELLETTLVARGYGFLALAGAASCALLLAYWHTRALRWAVALGGVTVLGTYTVPGYLFFGGPLLVALWLLEPNRRTFLVGVGAAVVIALLYAPMLPSLLRATGEYTQKEFGDFLTAEGVARAVRTYLFPLSNWQVATAAGLLGLGTIALPATNSLARTLRCLLLAVLAFFLAMVALQTPPLRMASFVMLPLGFGVVMTLGTWLRRVRPAGLALGVGAAATLALAARPGLAATRFAYLPMENWSEAAYLIDAAFPRDLPIDYSRHAKYLKHYLADGRPVLRDGSAEFARSGALVVEGRRLWRNGQPNESGGFAGGGPPPLVVPGSVRAITIHYTPPPDCVVPPPPVSGRMTEGAFPLPARPAQALVVIGADMERARIDVGGRRYLTRGNALVIPVEPEERAPIPLRVDRAITAAYFVPAAR